MADRHQLKIADRHGIAADDPFAELTRIMGFDPRRPAEAEAAPSHEAGQAEGSAQGDFDIDLEKELMGEFSAYAETESAVPGHTVAVEEDDDPLLAEMRQPAQPPVHGHVASDAEMDMDDAIAASLEDDFTVEAVDLEAPAPAPDPFAAEAETHADVQAIGDEHLPVQAESDADEVAQALQGTWFAPAEEETMAAEANADDLAMMSEPVDGEHDLDLDALDFTGQGGELWAVESSGDDDAAPAYREFAPQEASDAEPAPYQEPFEDDQPEAADAYPQPTLSATAVSDFDPHFDDAMADVDMDFAAAAPLEAPVSTEQTHYDAEVVSDTDTGIDDAFDRAFADVAPMPAAEAAPVEPAIAAPRENSLEDELNALLAKMTMRPAVSVASAWPLATPVARPRESAPSAAMPAHVEQTPVAEDDLSAALVADLHAMDFGDTQMPGEDIEFDADAFHAALADTDDDAVALAAGPVEASGWNARQPFAAQRTAASPRQDVPDVETIDVPERVVALADDLDIPDVPFEEPEVGKQLYDDLENEFAGLLGQMEAAPSKTRADYHDDAYGAGFRRGTAQPQADTPAQAAAHAAASAFHPAAAGLDADNLPGNAQMDDGDPFAVDDLAYDPEDTVDVSGLSEAAAARQRPRRGMLIAGLVCAVAVAGGLGALAMSFGGKDASDAPALVKADNAPIKVKPENPGGTVIPNQDNKVYEAVAKGIKPAAPEQQKLFTSNDEPVDVNTAAPQSRVVDLSGQMDGAAPTAAAPAANPATAKSEDRVEQSAEVADATPDVPVVAPRKVRTMVVKPDGSLVPREDPAPVVAATEPADPAPQHVVATGDQTGAVPPANADVGDASGESALKPATATGEVSTPKTAPIAPQRPSDQPVDVVGEVKPDKVASIDTTASAAGSWSMQIASQPTADSAQSTYQDLARRYASVLDGRSVNIVKADIAGKGTFYRVRVPTGSRNDAIKLCESYKAAGGNCFVSK